MMTRALDQSLLTRPPPPPKKKNQAKIMYVLVNVYPRFDVEAVNNADA